MYQTYAVIGSFLFVFGAVSLVYFVRFIKITHRKDTVTQSHLIEAAIALIVATVYIYAAAVASKNGAQTEIIPILNFTTNSLEDLAANVPHSMSQNEGIEIPENEENYYEATGNEEYTSTDDLNYSEHVTVTEKEDEETTTASHIPNDEFLKKYQTLFKEIIKKKIQNSSAYHNPIYFNNQKYRSFDIIKQGRQLQWNIRQMENKDKLNECDETLFLQNALLLYSFINCLLTLVFSSRNCKKCVRNLPIITPNTKTAKGSSSEINSDSSDSLSPGGPYFGEKIKSANIPGSSLFEVKPAQLQQSPSSSVKSDLNVIENESQDKVKLGLHILVVLLIPVLSIIILYGIVSFEHQRKEKDSNKNDVLNFNSTRSDPLLLNLIQTPINASYPDHRNDVNEVIKNVYNIVKSVNADNKQRAALATKMFDIVHYLNSHGRQHLSNDDNNCFDCEIPSKIYYFVTVIVVYFLTILYAKLSHFYIHLRNTEKAKGLNLCIISFSVLWLPCVLELFYRVYLVHHRPNIFSDIFLVMGNANKLVSLTSNYLESKKVTRRLNFVMPAV